MADPIGRCNACGAATGTDDVERCASCPQHVVAVSGGKDSTALALRLPQPKKSACFFCPASTKTQVRALAVEEPALFERALAIEDAALAAGNLKVVKGLGRHWTWREIAGMTPKECARIPDVGELPCGCWDGNENDE